MAAAGGENIFPDLHHKMSKKIAQLTKVIYHLNTKNDEHEYELKGLSESYEGEIDQILKDAYTKINEFRKQLELRKEQAKATEQLQEYIRQQDAEKAQALRDIEDFKKRVKDQQDKVKLEADKKIRELTRELEDAKRDFGDRLQQFANLTKMMDHASSAKESDLARAHQTEIDNLVKTHNKKYNEMLKEQMDEQERLRNELLAQLEKEKAEGKKRLAEAVKREQEAAQRALDALRGDLAQASSEGMGRQAAEFRQKLAALQAKMQADIDAATAREQAARKEADALRQRVAELEHTAAARMDVNTNIQLAERLASLEHRMHLQVGRVAAVEGALAARNARALELEKALAEAGVASEEDRARLRELAAGPSPDPDEILRLARCAAPPVLGTGRIAHIPSALDPGGTRTGGSSGCIDDQQWRDARKRAWVSHRCPESGRLVSKEEPVPAVIEREGPTLVSCANRPVAALFIPRALEAEGRELHAAAAFTDAAFPPASGATKVAMSMAEARAPRTAARPAPDRGRPQLQGLLARGREVQEAALAGEHVIYDTPAVPTKKKRGRHSTAGVDRPAGSKVHRTTVPYQRLKRAEGEVEDDPRLEPLAAVWRPLVARIIATAAALARPVAEQLAEQRGVISGSGCPRRTSLDSDCTFTCASRMYQVASSHLSAVHRDGRDGTANLAMLVYVSPSGNREEDLHPLVLPDLRTRFVPRHGDVALIDGALLRHGAKWTPKTRDRICVVFTTANVLKAEAGAVSCSESESDSDGAGPEASAPAGPSLATSEEGGPSPTPSEAAGPAPPASEAADPSPPARRRRGRPRRSEATPAAARAAAEAWPPPLAPPVRAAARKATRAFQEAKRQRRDVD